MPATNGFARVALADEVDPTMRSFAWPDQLQSEPPAVETLAQSARGLPRLINRIAHCALIAAAVKGARTVSAEHLEHAVAELRL